VILSPMSWRTMSNEDFGKNNLLEPARESSCVVAKIVNLFGHVGWLIGVNYTGERRTVSEMLNGKVPF
jgi:hypothetical protein